MRRRKQRIFYFTVLFLLMAVMLVYSVILQYEREKIRMNEIIFTESARELRNPERGFYNLYAFLITDEKADYMWFLEHYYKKDIDTDLTLIEINLQKYRDGKISEAGLQNIEVLFQVLGHFEKQMIVRFVYDLEGENEKYEPDTVDVILGHMEQLEDVLRKYSGKIYVLQGLFIGNWGEMNGSRYDTEENWRVLAKKLAQVTDESTYLGVRTPAQWRSLISIGQIPKGELPYTPGKFGMKKESKISPLWGRLGLFNDGMLGSEGDYGTYGWKQVSDAEWTDGWQREDELAFQDALCRSVPNGGETIMDNPYNDLSNALKDMSAMHVTYLNKWHDPSVLNKWADTIVEEDGCFNGMDGYTYVERHLGYRLLIESVQLNYGRRGSRLSVRINMKNTGFAPVYRNPELKLLIYREDSEEEPLVYPIEGQLCRLAGGKEAGDVLALQKEISLKEFEEGRYGIYFTVTDPNSGRRIYLANQQNAGEYGYWLGRIELKR